MGDANNKKRKKENGGMGDIVKGKTNFQNSHVV